MTWSQRCSGWLTAIFLLVPPQPVHCAVPRLPYNSDLGDKLHYCQWFSVQAAWGAQARFKGAPAAFRYVNRDLLRTWFMDDSAPPDAVYLLDELTLSDRPLYEEVALTGWKRMDEWLQATPEMQQPDWVLLPVPFYYLCKDGNDAVLPSGV
jgi:hypothetical protein